MTNMNTNKQHTSGLSAQANAANTAQPECAYPRCLAEGCDKACARVAPLLEGDAVRIPTSEDEAAAMVLVGMSWLQTNAPHRLRKGWISVANQPIPMKTLVDIFGPAIQRRTGCYYDHICDEWRQIERGILVSFKRHSITHWMPLPAPPEEGVSTTIAKDTNTSRVKL